MKAVPAAETIAIADCATLSSVCAASMDARTAAAAVCRNGAQNLWRQPENKDRRHPAVRPRPPRVCGSGDRRRSFGRRRLRNRARASADAKTDAWAIITAVWETSSSVCEAEATMATAPVAVCWTPLRVARGRTTNARAFGSFGIATRADRASLVTRASITRNADQRSQKPALPGSSRVSCRAASCGAVGVEKRGFAGPPGISGGMETGMMFGLATGDRSGVRGFHAAKIVKDRVTD